jgi:hypothetical protein
MVKPRSPPAPGGIQWGDEWIVLLPLWDKADCSGGSRKTVIFKVGSNTEKELEKINPWENSEVSLA